MPSGPTVTASGRHVRSRATGLYGETLHSGQVSDRASPATGDYVRSDVSEEPQQAHAHGRSTRAANRGTANGRPSDRTIVTDDEEDATSWDGGDEDEDEPEQMELDDDEDDQAEDSTEEEDKPQTLMVTLRYQKGSFNPHSGPAASNGTVQDALPANGVDHHPTHATGAALSGPGALRQPEHHILAPAEPPLQPALLSQPVATPEPPAAYIPNSMPILAQPPMGAPIVPTAQHPQHAGNSNVLPKLDGIFSAQTPPYSASEGNLPVQPPPPVQYPVGQPAQQPFAPTLPSPTPASSWQ